MSPPVSPLVARLIDDAGLFPPTALSMHDAVARHRRDLAGASSVLTHRFLCPASRIGELRAELTSADRIHVGLIADTGLHRVDAAVGIIDADPALELAAIEFPLASTDQSTDDVVAALPTDVPVFLEPVALADVVALAPEIARLSVDRAVGLKLRCGGMRAELFPTPTALAHALVTVARHNVMVKATAGLHHGVRYTDPATGFTHHGYLNLLVAIADAVAGADPAAVTARLLSTDRAALTRAALDMKASQLVASRRLFTSYGSCSTSTPLIEARDFGLIGNSKEVLL
ncbi:hypothetical protein GFY24_13550 [Nocardia sp. SYP-A9097]|nr:hypothetical protein [Nocardia sp. SYP-A9097]